MAALFDFHYHPMFKQYLSQFENVYPTQRDPASLMNDVRLERLVAFFDKLDLHFLGSQSGFNQMTNGSELIGVANVVSLEYAFAAATDIEGNSLLEALLRSLVKPLDVTYFRNVHEGKISYYHLFIKELNLYSRLANIGTWRQASQDAYVNILARSKNDTLAFDDITGNGKITLAIAMEGGHNLNRNLINNPADQLESIPDPGNTDAIYADFYANCNNQLSAAQSLVKLYRAMWQEELDLLYVTLTHLSFIKELPLAAHAYGMKLLKNDLFHPSGNGLTDEGRAVISAAYGMTVGGRKTPVLIDIKHMSLKSRLDFYAYRKQMNYKLPILATHMGVTGWTINKWVNTDAEDNGDGSVSIIPALQVVGIENSADPSCTRYYFNPWTINLMDDDIIEILNSKGMIGLSLDKRIIGAKATDENWNYDSKQLTEYMSKAEYDYLKAAYASADLDPVPDDDPDTEVDTDPKNELNFDDRNKVRELANLAFTIVHIAAVGLSYNVPVDPWRHITLGSDYDGLIEPMTLADYCTDLNDTGLGGNTFNNISNILMDLLPSVETSYLHYRPYVKVAILPRNDAGDVDMQALQEKVNGILHDNGAAFLEMWYTDGLNAFV